MNRVEARQKLASAFAALGVQGSIYPYKIQRTDGATPITTIASAGVLPTQWGASIRKKYFLAVTTLVLWPTPAEEEAGTWTTQKAEDQADEQAEAVISALHAMREDQDALSIEYTDRTYLSEVLIEGHVYLAETFQVEVNDQ